MTRFEVDVAQVDQAAAAVSGSAGRIAAEVDAMMRHLLTLQDSWRGSAAASFQQLSQEWRGTQERVRLSLEQIQHALVVASQHYAEAEAGAARMFSG